MKAAVYTQPGQIDLRIVPDPKIGPGDALIRVRACGLCGTDIRKVLLRLPKPPVVLGHEVAGEIVHVGEEVTRFRPGDRVVVAHHTPCYACHYCRHGSVSMCRKFKSSNLDPGGFSELVRIPAGHLDMTAFPIPKHLTFEEAIFMEPLACVVRNFRRAHLLAGDTVLVVGLGSMGLLAGQYLKNIPVQLIGVDLKKDRCELATRIGFDRAFQSTSDGFAESLRDLTQGRGADLVLLTAGDAELYGRAVAWVRDGGYLNIFAGLAPGQGVRFDGDEIYHREITIFSSYSPDPSDLHQALELISTKRVRVDVLPSRTFGLSQIPAAIEACRSGEIMKAIIQPGHPEGAL